MKGRPVVLWIAIFGGLLGSFQYGYQLGVLNPSLSQIGHFFKIDKIDDPKASLLVTQLLIGASIGSFIAGALGDVMGPKSALQVANCLTVIGAVICSMVSIYWQFSIGRFILGLASGAFSSLPMWYIKDISPEEMRGAAGAMNQIFTNLGILTAYIMGLPYRNSHAISIWWRIMQAFALGPCVLTVIILCFVPESYIWLSHQNKRASIDKAFQVLQGRSRDDEFQALLENQHTTSDKLEAGSALDNELSQFQKFKLIFHKEYQRVVLLSIGMLVLIQLSGINLVIFYSNDVLRQVGFEDPILGSIATGMLNVVATFVATFIIDSVGRRPLFIVGYGGMSICFLGIAFTLISKWNIWILFIFMMIYIILFGLGVGSITVLYSVEILPSHIQGWTQSIGFSLNWLCVIGVGFLFPLVLNWIGQVATFALFAVFCFSGFLFSLFLVVETKKHLMGDI